MKFVLLLLSTVFCAVLGRVEAVDLSAKTVSSSKQFIVYSSDANLRGRVCGFGDEVKAEVLRILGEPDRWKSPILITLERASAPEAVPVSLKLFETPEGSTVQIDVQIGEDPAAVNLQKQIVRAVLLDFIYREKGTVKAGERYLEAPWWLVEGILMMIRQRDFGVDSGFFRATLENKRVPDIEELLRSETGLLGSAVAESVDAGYAMCLLQLLLEQPGGRANLLRLIRHWPEQSQDPVTALTREFPALGASATALQKWWTLNVARLSASDRYLGLTAEATDQELTNLLSFELVINKAGEKKKFSIGDFPEFSKLPACRAKMLEGQAAVIALSARANALLRPVVADYEKIFAALARGKTHGLAERLAEAELERKTVLQRVGAIADYLNFYEATQFGTRSNAFESFMRAANEISAQEARKRKEDPIARYLDELQQEF